VHRFIKAASASALAICVVLFALAIAVDSWDLHKWRESVLASASEDAVVLNPPALSFTEIAAYRSKYVIGFLLIGAIWSLAVVVPAIVGARRWLRERSGQRFVATAVVVTASAVAGSYLPMFRGNILPASIVFPVGALVGLLAVAIVEWRVPPNKSLERTRGR
jgi:hypothetical protein